MRLLLASVVVTLVATAGCAGQIITVGSKGDRDSGGEGDDGGPVEDVVVVDTYLPPPFDAQPPPFDSPIVVEDTGPCLVGLEPCISDSQCCSGICNGTCQDTRPPPGCLPDGDSCNGSQPCCSGPCENGVCGVNVQDAGPPVICAAPANNPCFDCLATACCPQLAACEGDPECTQSLACFEGCFTPGNGLTCSQKCNQAYPSPFESPLTSCATSACLPVCQ
jgi:hypothetical protein